MIDDTKYYVFYDGDCGFCNHWVQWILKNDKNDQFLFSALQSRFGQDFLQNRGLAKKQFDTLYLWKPNSFYLIKSQAVFRIAKLLGGKYQLISVFNIFPVFLLDLVYSQISKHRKKIANLHCLFPDASERQKFLE